MTGLDIFRLLRPRQWVKNAFVFLPLFFSGRMTDWSLWVLSLIAAAGFSLAASAVYCLNDYVDAEADRRHPKKSSRPIASGKVSGKMAMFVMACCLIGAFCFCILLSSIRIDVRPDHEDLFRGIHVGLVIGAYYLINVGYCLRIKKIAIVDVFVVAIGYVLRIVAGGLAGGIWLSPWIVILTFLLALLLAFGKRRDDVLMNERGETVTRKNTLNYNPAFLDMTMGVICAVTIVSYVMYCVSPDVVERLGSEYVYVTAVFVLLGLLRYMQIVIVEERSGSPTDIVMNDGMIRLAVIGWLICFAAILYF